MVPEGFFYLYAANPTHWHACCHAPHFSDVVELREWQVLLQRLRTEGGGEDAAEAFGLEEAVDQADDGARRAQRERKSCSTSTGSEYWA